MESRALFDHIPPLHDTLKRLLSSKTASQTYNTRRLRIHLSDEQIGFAPITRRADYDVEAALILGGVLRMCNITTENGGLPRVWSQPKKAELREIARMPKKEDWKRCGKLLSRPRVLKKEGKAIWEELGIFRVSEEEREVMEVVKGRKCFMEVPAGIVVSRGFRNRFLMRLRNFGNVEREGEMRIGVLGRAKKRYGKIIGCMPVIPEEGSGEDETQDWTSETDEKGKSSKENEGLNDSGVCSVNPLHQIYAPLLVHKGHLFSTLNSKPRNTRLLS